MALEICNECGREVSTNAASCPNCGNPIKKAEPQTYQSCLNGCAWIIIIGIILIGIGFFSSFNSMIEGVK